MIPIHATERSKQIEQEQRATQRLEDSFVAYASQHVVAIAIASFAVVLTFVAADSYRPIVFDAEVEHVLGYGIAIPFAFLFIRILRRPTWKPIWLLMIIPGVVGFLALWMW